MSDSLTVTLLRSQYDDLVARVETLTAERAKAHQWLVEHMADPDDDDDDFARLLERLFRFGDQGWGEAGRQTSRADAAEARVETLTAELDEARNDVRVMSDHHRALERRADVAEARAETLENALRREWWLNHGCPIGSVYGDDGEMSCGSCATDFKRTPFEDLRQRVVANRTLRARAALASRPAGEEETT